MSKHRAWSSGWGDLGKQAAHVLRRQGFGQWVAPAQEMARFDGIAPECLAFCRQVLKEMLEGMEPPIDRGGRALVLALVLDKLRHVASGNGARGPWPPARKTGGAPADNYRRCAANSSACADKNRRALPHEVPCLPPPGNLPLGNFRHRLLVLVPFGRVIELRIAQSNLN